MSVDKPHRTSRLPNGTEEDCSYIFAGREMTVADSKKNEKALELDPNNLVCRLMLLGFYGHRSSDQKKYPRGP